LGGARVEARGLGWRPAARRQPVLRDLDLSIEDGERVLLAGPSGAGKSTLLRAFAGLLLTADVGDLSGEVLVGGEPPQARPGRVALLLQDPSASLVAERIGRDVAFGLENLRVPRDRIWPAVEDVLASVGLPRSIDHPTHGLSGGEMQRLALAGALAMRPDVLLLDEPTSMLDPDLAAEVRSAVAEIVRRSGSTLVVVEHRLDGWLDLVDRLVVLDEGGRVVADGPVHLVLQARASELADCGIWVPEVAHPEPLKVGAGVVAPHADVTPNGSALRAHRVSVVHKTRVGGGRTAAALALDAADAAVGTGEIVAVTGRSGAGKSTLVSVLGGLLKPSAGVIEAFGHSKPPWRWPSPMLARHIAWVPQQPEHGFVARTVLDEVLTAARATDRRDFAEERARSLLDVLGISHLSGAHPYRVSGGEQRRVMVAAALAHGPAALLLDEPTVGQDRHTWSAVVGACIGARDAGLAVALATHDRLTIETAADREVHLEAGRVR
jgi:energy-coupling factor transport system permease/ATP-binding protein